MNLLDDPLAPLRHRWGGVRDLVDFSRDPYATMDQLYARHGPVSWVGAGPVRFALLLGPQANRFVLDNTALFSWRRAFAGLIPLAGEGALLVNDGDRHRRLRRLVAPAFTTRAVSGHIGTVASHIDGVLDGWRLGGVVEAYGQFRAALRRATVASLFGARALSRAEPVPQWLDDIHRVIDTHALVRRMQSLGLPAWQRALRARESVLRWVAAEIAHRRAEATAASASDPSDVLGRLLAAGDPAEAGPAEPLTEAEIADQLISLLEAGAETTSSAFGWALYCSLRDRDLWAALTAEVAAVAEPGAPLDAAALHRMELLDRVVAETLRLYPATVVASRVAASGFRFADHEFPAGAKLVFSPYHTHRLASVWPDPLRFDPGRWDPASVSYRRPETHEYLPFGGGPHRCVGAAFATVAVKAALAQVVRRADLWLVSTQVIPTGLIGMRPRDGLSVLVSRIDDVKEAAS